MKVPNEWNKCWHRGQIVNDAVPAHTIAASTIATITLDAAGAGHISATTSGATIAAAAKNQKH